MRFYNVQALRGIAALLVVVHHFLWAIRQYAPANAIANYFDIVDWGACGVDIFFCISGFVMLGSIGKLSNDASPIKHFAIGRVVRIAPLYWITTTISIGIVALNAISKYGVHGLDHQPLLNLSYAVYSYLLWPAINPESRLIQPFLAQGWTLSYELYFYIMLVLSCWALKFDLMKSAMLTVGLMLVIAIASRGMGVLGQFLSNQIVLEFGLGMIVFAMKDKFARLGILMIVAGSIALASTAFVHVDESRRFIFWGLPAFLILWAAVSMEGRIKINAPMKLLGDASYSIYLTHGFVTYVYGGVIKRGMFATDRAQDLFLVFGVLLSILVGIGFYFFLEKPITKYLNARFSRRKAGRVSPAQPARSARSARIRDPRG